MGVLDLVVPVLIVAVAERALARRPQSPAENLAAAEASRHLPVQGVRDMDQQDTLRVISALRNEARRLERIAKAANPDPPAYREGLREEVRAMDWPATSAIAASIPATRSAPPRTTARTWSATATS
jgi:hypothetical protein